MLTTIDEAKSDLQRESHKRWKLITPTEIKRYTCDKQKTVIAMCLDRHCRQLAYFVPVDAMPQRDLFATALTIAKRHNRGFMPVIQCNLDQFPEIVLPPSFFANIVVYIKLKATGKLSLQPIGLRNPLTYSMGKFHSLRVSAFSAVSSYLASPEWETRVTLDTNRGDIILSLTHKGTQQSATVSLKVNGDEVTGSITFYNAKFKFERWNFTGSYGLQITGKVLPRDNTTSLKPVKNIVHDEKLIHNTEVVLLVIGIGALSVLTDGAALGLFTTL